MSKNNKNTLAHEPNNVLSLAIEPDVEMGIEQVIADFNAEKKTPEFIWQGKPTAIHNEPNIETGNNVPLEKLVSDYVVGKNHSIPVWQAAIQKIDEEVKRSKPTNSIEGGIEQVISPFITGGKVSHGRVTIESEQPVNGAYTYNFAPVADPIGGGGVGQDIANLYNLITNEAEQRARI